MAISYAAQTGTLIDSFAMAEVLASQSQQTNNNTVVVSDTPANAAGTGGNIGSGANGVGDTYVGRLVTINLASGTGQQVRMCTAEAAGTGSTLILTVHEDWDTNPVVDTDVIRVCYELADIEDGGSSGGISLGSKTGLWELSNELHIGDATAFAGLQVVEAAALECSDEGANISFYVYNNGFYFMGYEASNTPVGGGIMTTYNNSFAEPWTQFQSGSYAYIYDSVLWSQLVSQQFEVADSANVVLWSTKIISGTEETHLYDTTVTDVSIQGKNRATEYVRVDGVTNINTLVISNTAGLHTHADTNNEYMTQFRDIVFIGNIYDININQGKRWTIINPIWDATTSDYSKLNFVSATDNYVKENFSVDLVVRDQDNATISGVVYTARTAVSGTSIATTINEEYTVEDGIVEADINSITYYSASTTTNSGFSIKAAKFLYKPFITSLEAEPYDSTVILLDDTDVSETDWSTAAGGADGSTLGITINTEDNPSSLLDYTAGVGSLSVDDVIYGLTSNASGTLTQILDGDSTAGTLHLKARDALDFTNGETLSGTSGPWHATYTASTQQDFYMWIDGNDKSLQVIYDFDAAHQDKRSTYWDWYYGVPDWGRGQQSKVMYLGANGFYTEAAYDNGVIVVNYGVGSVEYFTDDTGTTWVPPTTVTLEVNGVKTGIEPTAYVRVRVESVDGSIEYLNAEATTSYGSDGYYKAQGSTSYTEPIPVVIKARYKGFLPFKTTGTITATGLTTTAVWLIDSFYNEF